MKQLPRDFEKKGFIHVQEWREGNVAIYRRTRKGSEISHFETVRIRERAEQTVNFNGTPVTYPAQEIYPSSEEWGRMGVTALTYPDALQKAQNLLLSTKDAPSQP